MYKKALTVLLICAVFLSIGCTRKGGEVTPVVTATPTSSPAAGWTYIDPSLADVSGEDNDSIPEFFMPTPGPE